MTLYQNVQKELEDLVNSYITSLHQSRKNLSESLNEQKDTHAKALQLTEDLLIQNFETLTGKLYVESNETIIDKQIIHYQIAHNSLQRMMILEYKMQNLAQEIDADNSNKLKNEYNNLYTQRANLRHSSIVLLEGYIGQTTKLLKNLSINPKLLLNHKNLKEILELFKQPIKTEPYSIEGKDEIANKNKTPIIIKSGFLFALYPLAKLLFKGLIKINNFLNPVKPKTLMQNNINVETQAPNNDKISLNQEQNNIVQFINANENSVAMSNLTMQQEKAENISTQSLLTSSPLTPDDSQQINNIVAASNIQTNNLNAQSNQALLNTEAQIEKQNATQQISEYLAKLENNKVYNSHDGNNRLINDLEKSLESNNQEKFEANLNKFTQDMLENGVNKETACIIKAELEALYTKNTHNDVHDKNSSITQEESHDHNHLAAKIAHKLRERQHKNEEAYNHKIPTAPEAQQHKQETNQNPQAKAGPYMGRRL